MRSWKVLIGALCALTALAEVAPVAEAGGMQLPTRGVRATARAGAFVAGADDLGAMWFNPAGLAAIAGGERGASVLFDLAYVRQAVSYARIDSGNNAHDPVDSDAPGLPVPTLGALLRLDDRLVIAAGVYAPYAGLGRYDVDGPQRYSMVDMSESLMVILQASVAYQLTDRLRVGAGVQNMVFGLASTLVFSGCPAETVCAPEDPEFDAVGKVTQTTYFSPSGVLGAQYEVSPRLRTGLAVQLPFRISGKGRFETVLPPSGFYDGAEVVGERGDVSFTMPAMVRAGAEVTLSPRWRAELSASVELWSQHERLRIQPRDVRIENAPGVGTYEIGEMSIPRHFEDTFAVMVGLEGQPLAGTPLTVLAGYAYETGAPPSAYLSVLTVDGGKHLVAGGLGYRHGAWQLHATVAHAAMADRTVTPEEGRAPQLTPVRDDPSDPDPPRAFVNWGEYRASWLVAGLGLSAAF